MRRALALAWRGNGRTSPRPRVGAIVVRGGKIIGEGYFAQSGADHAEIIAIRATRKRTRSLADATLYVTLEPCSTHGRTPPCVTAIVREKFKRVVVAAIDPNPRHAGKGLKLLRRAGIQVASGLLAVEATEMNRDFNHWITTGRPWVTAKIAQSLDGRIKAPSGDDRWLTSPAARKAAHELRAGANAIVIGAETARADNPHLTVRLPGRQADAQPWRVVLTRSGKLPRGLNLFTDQHRKKTLIYKNMPVADVLKRLAHRDVMNVLVEGGGYVLGEFFAAGLVNEVAFFVAPCILGAGPMAVEWPTTSPLKKRAALRRMEIEKAGPDFLCRARVATRA